MRIFHILAIVGSLAVGSIGCSLQPATVPLAAESVALVSVVMPQLRTGLWEYSYEQSGSAAAPSTETICESSTGGLQANFASFRNADGSAPVLKKAGNEYSFTVKLDEKGKSVDFVHVLTFEGDTAYTEVDFILNSPSAARITTHAKRIADCEQ
jgi:hypothetical protein